MTDEQLRKLSVLIRGDLAELLYRFEQAVNKLVEAGDKHS